MMQCDHAQLSALNPWTFFLQPCLLVGASPAVLSYPNSHIHKHLAYDYVYTSADFGVTWTLQAGSIPRNWIAIVFSSDLTVRAMQLGAPGRPMMAARHTHSAID